MTDIIGWIIPVSGIVLGTLIFFSYVWRIVKMIFFDD